MPKHTCHLPPCRANCPPRHLFCREHWAMVPKGLQHNVLSTVGRRDKGTPNASWAPWWRAKSAVTTHVMQLCFPSEPNITRINRMEAHANSIADWLEKM